MPDHILSAPEESSAAQGTKTNNTKAGWRAGGRCDKMWLWRRKQAGPARCCCVFTSVVPRDGDAFFVYAW